MMNNYDYPMGADNPNAPWNQEDNTEREFHVNVSQLFGKTDTVKSSDYVIESSDKDEDGYQNISIDTSNVDFEKEWKDQRYDINDLLKELERLAIKELEKTPKENIGKISHFKRIIQSCKGWKEIETIVEQDV